MKHKLTCLFIFLAASAAFGPSLFAAREKSAALACALHLRHR